MKMKLEHIQISESDLFLDWTEGLTRVLRQLVQLSRILEALVRLRHRHQLLSCRYRTNNQTPVIEASVSVRERDKEGVR